MTLWHLVETELDQNNKKNCDNLRRSYPQRPHRCIIETRQLVVTSALTLWHLTFKWDQAIAVKRTICNWIPPWASTAVGFNSNPSPPRGKPQLNSNKATQTKRTSKRQQLNFLWSSLKRSSSSKTIISQQQRCWQQEQGQMQQGQRKDFKMFWVLAAFHWNFAKNFNLAMVEFRWWKTNPNSNVNWSFLKVFQAILGNTTLYHAIESD